MPGYRSAVADLLGLRYIVSGVPIEKIDANAKPDDFRLVTRTPDGYIYENPRALPRVMLATSTAPADFDKLLADGPMPDIDYRSTVLLETAEPFTPRRPGSARLVRYTNTRDRDRGRQPRRRLRRR